MITFQSIFAALGICLVLTGSMANAQKHPRELTQPTPLSFTPPKPVEFTLNNGIRVYFLEDRELPLVSISAILPGGSIYEKPANAGLASLTGSVMRTGGTQSISGDDLDRELEFLAATVEATMGEEYANVTASCLKKDFHRVVQLYADVIMHPAFPQAKIDQAKNQMKESIRRRWDQPAAAAGILFTEQELGGTPFGYRATAKTLKAITRDDLMAFHEAFFSPRRLSIGISGDLSREEASAALEKAFAGWKATEASLPQLPALQERSDGTIYYAYRDAPQASVVIGHLGIRRNNPDEDRLEVMNDIFGGRGFTARLMKEIRSNRGLTYGIYGGVFAGTDRGFFRIASQLKADRCVEALALVKQMIGDLQNTPVPEEELTVSKESLINGFVFQFESRERIPQMYIQNRLDGYPDDHFDTYISKIKNVTARDVQEVARKYMDTGKMIIVVVGDEKKFDKPLSSLGRVQAIDYKKIAESDKSED